MQPFLQGKRVLITGGGGSIGSELCRQAAAQKPAALAAADVSENGLFAVQQELWERYGPDVPFQAVIASIRDRGRIEQLVSSFRPDIILHAAAHKHVPFMERFPEEAVKNNILGTWNVIQAAEQADVERLVLISTDKAVEPQSVMGASKRVTERMLLPGRTIKAAVRFGNVVDSAGSVLPLFRRQIAEGGPVTVTDPRMTRYFMSIPEAAGLVLEAARLGENGGLFVLDMGEPVSILALAEKLVRESGRTDVPIRFTGLRPGERLEERLLTPEEKQTAVRMGKILRVKTDPFRPEELENLLRRFQDAAQAGNREEIFSLLKEAVPDYQRK
ncbi:MAG TPA: polysaccharide biosynthesis protein [Candidatus Merdivicinus excrementipullorum]|uniref:Polysaccharide biosynthesis protein n=1 Tax=Candidatus Merdivicinus excrementipullorum TaxID=2840867 RepID=A0A9D1FMM0_9FIRM|nr:polysaccharide biosynthesis protein [Candidatus Merdivicinus excrementipullorum]